MFAVTLATGYVIYNFFEHVKGLLCRRIFSEKTEIIENTKHEISKKYSIRKMIPYKQMEVEGAILLRKYLR